MATSIIDTLYLRDAVESNFITLADTLDVTEGDSNITVLGKWGQEMEAAINVPAYNAAVSYAIGAVVKYAGQLWTYINTTEGLVATPGTDAAIWELTSIGSLIGNATPNVYSLSLDGTSGNGLVNEYVTVTSLAVGTVIDTYKVLCITSNLTPNTGTPKIQLVLHDGTPANDVTISDNLPANEINSSVKIPGEAINTVASAADQILKLKVTGASISGDIKIKLTTF